MGGEPGFSLFFGIGGRQMAVRASLTPVRLAGTLASVSCCVVGRSKCGPMPTTHLSAIGLWIFAWMARRWDDLNV